MTHRIGIALSCFLSVGIGRAVAQQVGAESGVPSDRVERLDDFFGLDKLWRVDFELTPEAWDSLYPPRPPRMALSMRGSFSYAKAKIRFAGHAFETVGVRFKGNSTYRGSNGSLERSLKIDFDRYVDGQEFLGLKKLNLQNNLTDPTQLREAVSYAVYRGSGVPASRSAFARVYLTIPGRLDKEFLGLYTIVEQVDKEFLERHFGSRKGLLVKPEGSVLPYLGDTWDDVYDASYIPKVKVREEHTRPFIDLARLIDDASVEISSEQLARSRKRLAERVHRYLDVDEFLRYTAVTAILVNNDSPFLLPHNFYMAVPAKVGKVVWIPWDLNLSFGGLSMMGGSRGDSSVFEPSNVAAIARVLEIPAIRERYRALCDELLEGPCSFATIRAQIDTAHDTIRDALADEKERSEAVTKAAPDPGSRSRRGGFNWLGRQGRRDPITSAKSFLAKRLANVRDQVDGVVRGRAAGRGMFSRTSSPGATVARLFTRSQPLESDEYSAEALRTAILSSFAKVDTNESKALERKEVEAELGRQTARWAGMMQRGGQKISARRTWIRLDADRDRLVTAEEWTAAIERALARFDRNEDGTWTRSELRRIR